MLLLIKAVSYQPGRTCLPRFRTMITVKTLGLITLIFDILSTCQHVLVGQKVESSIRLKKMFRSHVR